MKITKITNFKVLNSAIFSILKSTYEIEYINDNVVYKNIIASRDNTIYGLSLPLIFCDGDEKGKECPFNRIDINEFMKNFDIMNDIAKINDPNYIDKYTFIDSVK